MKSRPLTTACFLLGVMSAGNSLKAQAVRGRVTDDSTKAPILEATVRLMTDDRVEVARASTDSGGRFAVAARSPGRYRLRFERVGYRPVLTRPFQLRLGESAEYGLEVHALAPFALDTVTVEGRLVPHHRLAGFYDRRARRFGEFLTREEFERFSPMVVTDLIRHAETFELEMDPAGRYDPPFREYRIISRRALRGFGPGCPPLVFLDDALMGDADQVNLDDVVAVDHVEAMEFYDGVQVPVEYQANGSNCGVLLVWSRVPGGEPGIARHVELGAQVGGYLAGNGLQDGRIGAHLSVGLAGVFEFYPAFNVLLSTWSGQLGARSGLQGTMSLRARPFGVDSPWYVGAGITAIDTEEGVAGSPRFRESFSEQHAVLFTGVRIPLRWVRPML